MARKVFGALGQLSFSLGVASLRLLVFRSVVFFLYRTLVTAFLEAAYFQFTSGPFDFCSRGSRSHSCQQQSSFGFLISVFNLCIKVNK